MCVLCTWYKFVAHTKCCEQFKLFLFFTCFKNHFFLALSAPYLCPRISRTQFLVHTITTDQNRQLNKSRQVRDNLRSCSIYIIPCILQVYCLLCDNKTITFYVCDESSNRFILSVAAYHRLGQAIADEKSHQWFGATLSTSGVPNGPVVVSIRLARF